MCNTIGSANFPMSLGPLQPKSAFTSKKKQWGTMDCTSCTWGMYMYFLVLDIHEGYCFTRLHLFGPCWHLLVLLFLLYLQSVHYIGLAQFRKEKQMSTVDNPTLHTTLNKSLNLWFDTVSLSMQVFYFHSWALQPQHASHHLFRRHWKGSSPQKTVRKVSPSWKKST